MFRISILAIAGLALFGLGGSRSSGENPQPAQPKTLPVAPFPHIPAERKLSDDDEGPIIDIQGVLPKRARLEGERIEPIDAFPALPKPKSGNSTEDKPSPAFAGRTGDLRTKLYKENGGNQESERVVALGLAWLAKQQKADGSWIYDGKNKDEVAAATGMALLVFLGAGETHTNGKMYREAVRKGLNWLLTHLPAKGQNAGKFEEAREMYAQAIGTLALCEAYGMTHDKELLAPAQAAINYLQAAQAPNGSWGYQPGALGDVSITGWQIEALQAAQLSKDLEVSNAVIKKAIQFLDLVGAGSRKSTYGYNDNTGAAPGTSLTSVGLLCRYYTDKWGPDTPGMAEGVIGLMKRAPGRSAKPAFDMYFFYYATQVVHFFGGDEWKTWNDGPKQPDGSRRGGIRDWLIDLQIKEESENRGSWDPDPGFIGLYCGRLGTTALCLLTLEVYYRYPVGLKTKINPDAKKGDK